MSRRTDRVEDLIRRELSDLLLRDLHDPRVGMASVVSVHVTADLRHAVVRMSVLGDEESRRTTIETLTGARGFVRSQLAHRLRRMKIMPELTFELDRGAEYSQKISQILEGLRDDDTGT